MAPKIGALAFLLLCVTLLAAASPRAAQNAPQIHPGPWPIWNWHNHQPRQDQLDAMHKSDVTPDEAREIDRLYMQLEHADSRLIVPKKEGK